MADKDGEAKEVGYGSQSRLSTRGYTSKMEVKAPRQSEACNPRHSRISLRECTSAQLDGLWTLVNRDNDSTVKYNFVRAVATRFRAEPLMRNSGAVVVNVCDYQPPTQNVLP